MSYNKGKDNPRWGVKLSEETKQKCRLSKLGNKNPEWKETGVSYKTIHQWVNRHKGKANECGICKKPSAEWANIDHNYRRNLNDYIALCEKCHWAYDKKLGLRGGK